MKSINTSRSKYILLLNNIKSTQYIDFAMTLKSNF